MDHGVVQKWLREVLHPYNDADRVFADVDQTLIAVSSLSPKTEVYTYDDGRTQLLLLLSGTIPINYRNATYNIPMDIWVPRLYPREAPISYVRPTNDMLIRKGRNVDVSGRVGGDYLQRWERKWESCNLLELVHNFQEMFGQEPPVYAKPRQITTNTPASPVASGSRIPMGPMGPMDPRERRPPPPPSTHQSSPSSDIVPLRPPKTANPYSSYDGSKHFTSSPSPASAAGWTVSPRHPNSGHAVSQEITPNGHGWERSPSETRQASWHATSDNSHSSMWTRQNLDNSNRSASLQSAGPPTQDITLATSPPVLPGPYPQQRSSYVSSPSLSSTILSAPPRPPNPELLQMHTVLHHKIQSRLQHIRTTQGDVQHQLKLLISDLDRGEPAIRDEMARLEAVRDVCRATGDGLQEAVSSGKGRIEELKSRSEPDVDGMICATSIVGNQLIDLVAGDSAIGDTLFYLGQALHSEVIEVEKYLKQTRFLAREQFMRRALAQKISEGMGW